MTLDPIDPVPLATLPRLALADLRARWEAAVGTPLPFPQSRALLGAALAWELQAQHHGGLPPPVRRQLRKLVAALAQGHWPSASRPSARLQPGTVLTRVWRGTRYTVVVDAKGFVYDGTVYASLSHVARRITGTRWNGPAFFGVRPRAASRPTRRPHGQ